REQIDVFSRLQRRHRLEAARQQDLVNQRLELRQVALEVGLVFRFAGALEQLERKPDARERRAQLVRRVGEQQTVRTDQLLNAAGGTIETLGQTGDLVVAGDRDTRTEIARTQRLDASLQSLQPTRQAAHHRIGA